LTGVEDEDLHPSPRSAPAHSAELQQRMPPAVTAERSQAVSGDQDRPPGGEVTTPSVRSRARVGKASGVGGKRRRVVTAQLTRPAELRHAARSGRTAFAAPVVEDEDTEWLGTVGGSRPAAGLASAAGLPRGVEAAPAAGPGGEPQSAATGPASGPGAVLTALVVIAALVIGSLAAVAFRHLARSPGSSPASTTLARQQAAVREEAAAWVAQQVSRDVTVSCDPVMCAALAAHGFPSGHLLMLGPTSPSAVRTAVVVETAAVRGLFGTSLALAWAPAVLASFGSGPAAVTVRVIAPHGAAAYQTALAASEADGQAAGSALLRNPRVTVLAPAGGQLAAGLVDLRLLRALKSLAGHQPVSIVQFGNTGPGASAGVPLRSADLAESGAGYVRAVRTYLSGVDTGYRPASMTNVVLPGGQAVLRVEFAAPSLLGVSGAPGSP
jgi:hypothetical protein